MAILRKSTIETSLGELERFYEQLKEAVRGVPISKSEAHMYAYTPKEYDAFVRVDIDRVLDAVGHFKVSVDALRRLKSKEAKSNNNGPYFGPDDKPF